MELDCFADKEHQQPTTSSTPQRTLRDQIEGFAADCRKVSLKRKDHSPLYYDEASNVQFTWLGTYKHYPSDGVPMTYHVMRWRWKTKEGGNKKEYTRYDYLDCLNSDRMKIIPTKPT